MAGVHRWLIEPLGDAQSIAEIEHDGYLPAIKFGQAVERVRQARYGQLPAAEGLTRVGADLANTFLDSQNGRVLAESIEVLPLDRALKSVVLPLSERMRKAAEFDFLPASNGPGGRILVKGAFVVSGAMLVGFFGAIVARIPGNFSVRIAEQTAENLIFDVIPPK
ncbi:MAG: hypothetical protein QM817_12540 [Archangium sp.]